MTPLRILDIPGIGLVEQRHEVTDVSLPFHPSGACGRLAGVTSLVSLSLVPAVRPGGLIGDRGSRSERTFLSPAGGLG
jgi:hypothetical protein